MNGESWERSASAAPPMAREDDRGEKRAEKIVVVGPGVVGMALAALHANRRAVDLLAPGVVSTNGHSAPRRVVVIQRRSVTSGWKIEAINSGRSSIGGIEPHLDAVTAEAVASGQLRATDDYFEARDADLVIVCVQTDRDGAAPDYAPLLAALHPLARAIRQRPEGHVPLVVIESTLAPSTMSTVIRDHFASYGLIDGRDLLLGCSPNRVMPGRLIDRVIHADKLIGGLVDTTADRIAEHYERIVTKGELHRTNCLTAEVVKTLENAYRDVRIAYAAEVCEFCDARDIDFFALRDVVNARLAEEDAASSDPLAVADGAVLVPLLGVGGHCLPKDGVLLWWRALERGDDATRSLLLEARYINDAAPGRVAARLEATCGPLPGTHAALLGVAYRPDSDDTRNSPTLALARLLRDRGVDVRLHDPWVRADDPNVARAGFSAVLTRTLDAALDGVDVAVLGVCHRAYRDDPWLVQRLERARYVFDGANALPRATAQMLGRAYGGIGRGHAPPDRALVEDVVTGFGALVTGVANETAHILEMLNRDFAKSEHEVVSFEEVRRLAATCATGCRIGVPGIATQPSGSSGFDSMLVRRALGTAGPMRWTP